MDALNMIRMSSILYAFKKKKSTPEYTITYLVYTRCDFFSSRFFYCPPDYMIRHYTMSTSARQLLAAFMTATSFLHFLYNIVKKKIENIKSSSYLVRV